MEKLVRCTQTRSKLICYNYHDGQKAPNRISLIANVIAIVYSTIRVGGGEPLRRVPSIFQERYM